MPRSLLSIPAYSDFNASDTHLEQNAKHLTSKGTHVKREASDARNTFGLNAS